MENVTIQVTGDGRQVYLIGPGGPTNEAYGSRNGTFEFYWGSDGIEGDLAGICIVVRNSYAGAVSSFVHGPFLTDLAWLAAGEDVEHWSLVVRAVCSIPDEALQSSGQLTLPKATFDRLVSWLREEARRKSTNL